MQHDLLTSHYCEGGLYCNVLYGRALRRNHQNSGASLSLKASYDAGDACAPGSAVPDAWSPSWNKRTLTAWAAHGGSWWLMVAQWRSPWTHTLLRYDLSDDQIANFEALMLVALPFGDAVDSALYCLLLLWSSSLGPWCVGATG